MEPGWRAGFAQDRRSKMVDRIMDTLQRHTPLSGQDGVNVHWMIANRLEENIFYAATGEYDYLRKLSFEMLKFEIRMQNAPNGPLPTSSSGTAQSSVVRPLDSGMTQVQSRQQVVQSSQAGMLNNGMQSSANGQASSFSRISNVPQQQPPVLNALGQVSGNLPAPWQNFHSQMQQARQQQQQARQQGERERDPHSPP
eukprot:c24983_g2_i1 orf=213-803(+)